MNFDDGSKRGYTCCYKDGSKKTNLTYLESLEFFNEALESDNPCSVTPPGYGADLDPKYDKRNEKKSV